MTQTFETWLNAEMSNRGIRSARRFAMESGLDAEHVADWLLGVAMPSDGECDALAKFLNVPAADVRERRFPSRRRPGQ